MVDKHKRRAYAELLRHFGSDLMTNEEYEREVRKIFGKDWKRREFDIALSIIREAVWFLYSDIREHTLALTTSQRSAFARWVLFLYTEYEYRWPHRTLLYSPLKWVLTLGIGHRKLKKRVQAAGDWDYWPFIAKEEYEAALAHPPFLYGKRLSA